GISGQTSLPGGQSGVLGSPLYANLLPRWLTNETHPLRQRLPELLRSVAEVTLFLPQRRYDDDDDD
ncbi:MAG: penicillin acylase family protein, partial [Kiloniellales bacterium]|nr:penicillin acylase family protein [Kiloniellales bacterium]